MKTILLIGLLTATFGTPATCQTQLYHGTWTRLGTTYLFEFDLHLEHGAGNSVEGYFKWKFVKYDEDDSFSVGYYQEKIGMTAKEYVKGTWDATTRNYRLKGYKKDDPNSIIALDEYLLTVDDEGDLGGKTNSQGGWLGRINAQALVLLNL